jgi:predicted RNase H-like HicB family nuclease
MTHPLEDDSPCYNPAEDSFVATVNELATRTGQSKAEVLANAVNLYYDFVDKQQSTDQEKVEIQPGATALIQQKGPWWIGWVEEVPGVNAQERTRDSLLASLTEILREEETLRREKREKLPTDETLVWGIAELFYQINGDWLSANDVATRLGINVNHARYLLEGSQQFLHTTGFGHPRLYTTKKKYFRWSNLKHIIADFLSQQISVK